MNLLSTVTKVGSYCRTVVYEFYCNLLSGVGDVNSAKFGTVFIRDKLYEFSPTVINKFFWTHEGDVHNENLDLDTAATALTGGLITVFPNHPKKLAAAKLSSFYSILHKTAIKNWTPSTNSTVVTSNQLSVLFAIGTRQSFNFGRIMFDTILQFADGACKGSKLPFSSLIYGLLLSQGFIGNLNEECSGGNETLKISTAYFKGHRKLDLPWNCANLSPDLHTASTSKTVPIHSDFSEFIKLPTSLVKTKIEFGLAQIDHAKSQIQFYTEQIAHFENEVADFRLLLDVGVFSEQKGGVQEEGKNEDPEAE